MLPETVVPENLLEALKALNWSYGKGEIVGFKDVTFHGQGIHGEVVIKLQFGEEVRRFTLTNGVLSFRGHQKKISV